jgi:hypothetical protein
MPKREAAKRGVQAAGQSSSSTFQPSAKGVQFPQRAATRDLYHPAGSLDSREAFLDTKARREQAKLMSEAKDAERQRQRERDRGKNSQGR